MSKTDLLRAIRECLSCGRKFSSWGHFKCGRCRGLRSEKRHTIRVVCETCGVSVDKMVHHKKETRRFCSVACFNRSPEKRRAAAARMAKVGGLSTHGESVIRSPEYDVWRGMKRRCEPSNERARPYYADRGITVCERWAKNYSAFLEDVGRRPGPEYSLDRIDNDGNYEPGNVRWATWSQQMLNRRKFKISSRKTGTL